MKKNSFQNRYFLTNNNISRYNVAKEEKRRRNIENHFYRVHEKLTNIECYTRNENSSLVFPSYSKRFPD